MDTIKIYDATTGNEVLSSEFIRFSLSDNMLAVMLAGSVNAEARKLSTTKLYRVHVEQDGTVLVDAFGNFVSYNFIYMNADTDPNLAVGDNTILFKIFD